MSKVKFRVFVHVPNGDIDELPTADDMEYSDAIFVSSSIAKDTVNGVTGVILGKDTDTHIYIKQKTVELHVFASNDIDVNRAGTALGISLVATLSRLLDLLDKYED